MDDVRVSEMFKCNNVLVVIEIIDLLKYLYIINTDLYNLIHKQRYNNIQGRAICSIGMRILKNFWKK